MKNYIKHWLWFTKESYSFMRGYNKISVTFGILRRGHGFAKSMCQWDKMTAKQKEAWYLSGEGRTLEF
jgi:hypothetical protein